MYVAFVVVKLSDIMVLYKSPITWTGFTLNNTSLTHLGQVNGSAQKLPVLFGKGEKILLLRFTFSKNNRFQNILILYHIDNFLLLFK
jgi:hypothetical protein